MIVHFKLDEVDEALDYIREELIEPMGSQHITRAYRENGSSIYVDTIRIQIPEKNMSVRYGECNYKYDDEWESEEVYVKYELNEKKATRPIEIYSNCNIEDIVNYYGKNNDLIDCYVDTDEFSFDSYKTEKRPVKGNNKVFEYSFYDDEDDECVSNHENIEQIENKKDPLPKTEQIDEKKTTEKTEKENPERDALLALGGIYQVSFEVFTPEIIEYLKSLPEPEMDEEETGAVNYQTIGYENDPCYLRIHDGTGYEWLVTVVHYGNKPEECWFELGYNNFWEDNITDYNELRDIAENTLVTPLKAEIILNKTIGEVMKENNLSRENSFI